MKTAIDKAKAMHLRDVAMNGLGAWLKQDLDYTRTAYSEFGPDHSVCEFVVNGKKFAMHVKRVD